MAVIRKYPSLSILFLVKDYSKINYKYRKKILLVKKNVEWNKSVYVIHYLAEEFWIVIRRILLFENSNIQNS